MCSQQQIFSFSYRGLRGCLEVRRSMLPQDRPLKQELSALKALLPVAKRQTKVAVVG